MAVDFAEMKNPAASWRGIKELEEFQLLEVFFGKTLTLDMMFHHLPVGTLANGGHVISIRPPPLITHA